MKLERLAMLRRGPVKRIHVDQQLIRQYHQDGQHRPAITVQTSKGSIKGTNVQIIGPSTLIQRLEKPLSCGARIWIETRAEVRVITDAGETLLTSRGVTKRRSR